MAIALNRKLLSLLVGPTLFWMTSKDLRLILNSAVPRGSGAFHMPTCLSSSTFRGEGSISETLQ